MHMHIITHTGIHVKNRICKHIHLCIQHMLMHIRIHIFNTYASQIQIDTSMFVQGLGFRVSLLLHGEGGNAAGCPAGYTHTHIHKPHTWFRAYSLLHEEGGKCCRISCSIYICRHTYITHAYTHNHSY